MATCDVLIVGGGPAGSTCAWRLRQAGLDVIVVDAATFPRDKVCAGWITPQVVDRAAPRYRRRMRDGRTFQPITGFRVGLIGGRDATAVALRPSRQLRHPPLRVRSLSAAARRRAPDARRADRERPPGRRRRGSSTTRSARRCWSAPAARAVRSRGCSTAPRAAVRSWSRGKRSRASSAADSRRSRSQPARAGAVLLPRSAGLRLVRAQRRLSQRRPRPTRSAIAAGGDGSGSSRSSKRRQDPAGSFRGDGAAMPTRSTRRRAGRRRRRRRAADRRRGRPRGSAERRRHPAGRRIGSARRARRSSRRTARIRAIGWSRTRPRRRHGFPTLRCRARSRGLVPDRVKAVVAGHLLGIPAFVKRVVIDEWFLHRRQLALEPVHHASR